jgi:CheY-like chemotaxis protein
VQTTTNAIEEFRRERPVTSGTITARKPVQKNPVPKRVLVVDDDLDTAHSMVRLIRLMGHECEFAINGIAALGIARRFKPDVVLLDIGLPDSRGWEVARQLRRMPELEATRILAVTGNTAFDDARRSLEAGCEQHFSKPMSPDELERLLA